MINLNTPSDELWDTLSDEYEKAKYWMIKHFGGEKRYEVMRDDLLRRSVYAQNNLTSEVVYYTSRNGNRWICFEKVTYYPESFASNSMPNCFCYYETASSLGLFFPGFDRESNMNSVLIFTPHFFQRYAERMGITGDKKDLLLKFACSTCSMTISPVSSDNSSLEKVAVRIAGDCTGHGIRRSGDKNIFEVRTILTDAQLSKAQNARTERVRNLGDVMRYEPKDVAKRKMELCANPVQAYNEKMNQMQALGIDTSRQEEGLNISCTMSLIFMKMGIATVYDMEFWDRYHKLSHDPILYFLMRQEDSGESFHAFKETVATAREIAARMGIKKFAWREFAQILLVDYYKLSDSEASEIIKVLYG